MPGRFFRQSLVFLYLISRALMMQRTSYSYHDWRGVVCRDVAAVPCNGGRSCPIREGRVATIRSGEVIGARPQRGGVTAPHPQRSSRRGDLRATIYEGARSLHAVRWMNWRVVKVVDE